MQICPTPCIMVNFGNRRENDTKSHFSTSFRLFVCPLDGCPFSNTFAYVMQLIKSFSGRWSKLQNGLLTIFFWSLAAPFPRDVLETKWGFFFALSKSNLHRHSRVLALPKKAGDYVLKASKARHVQQTHKKIQNFFQETKQTLFAARKNDILMLRKVSWGYFIHHLVFIYHFKWNA